MERPFFAVLRADGLFAVGSPRRGLSSSSEFLACASWFASAASARRGARRAGLAVGWRVVRVPDDSDVALSLEASEASTLVVV